jgi:hypothetical protein
VRVRVSRRRRRTIPRWLKSTLGIALLIVVVVAFWLTLTGLRARSDLNAARAELARAKTAISDGDIVAAKRAVADAGDKAKRARQSTSDIVWRAVTAIPFLGDIPSTVRGLAQEADTVANSTLTTALQADKALDPGKARPSPDRVDLSALVAARGPLSSAAASAQQAERQVRALPAVGYFPPVAKARRQFLSQVSELSTLLHRAETASQLLPPMLGLNGVRRYFMAFQTNAEARGTGGLAGAFAIIRADHGRVAIEKVASDGELAVLPHGFSAGLSREYYAAYGELGTEQLWGNTNMSPHFPDVARIWMGIYQQLHPSLKLDGALATDPVALSYVLEGFGPLTVRGDRVTSSNVVKLLEVDTYARFANDNVKRKEFLVQVASAVLHDVLARGSNARDLLTGMSRAAAEGRALVYSRHQDEQERLAVTEVGGSIDAHRGPSAFLVINNDGGNKLDYYLRRSLSYTAGSCRQKTRESVVHIDLSNVAPRTGLPPDVIARLDLPTGARYVAGTSHSFVWLYTTHGALYAGGTIDGQQLLLGQEDSYGHTLYKVELDIAPGQTRRLVIHLMEPVVAGAAWVPIQPLIDAMQIQVKVPACA